MKKFLSALPVILLSSTLPAVAEAEGEKHPIDAKIGSLMEKAVSTADMIQAYDKGIALWDAELNRVYQALRKGLPAPASEKLKSAQQQWILYRDAQYAMLDAQYDAYDGTMYLPMRVAARMRVTADRARYLKLLLETHQEHGRQ